MEIVSDIVVLGVRNRKIKIIVSSKMIVMLHKILII